jgi:hypothetical protein
MKHLKLFEDSIESGQAMGGIGHTWLKFIAVLHQSGGCDYTIECGTKVIELDSGNIDSATDEINSIIEDEYTGEMSLSEVTLYEIKGKHDINLKDIYNNIKSKRKSASDLGNDKKERSEFERLSKKFNNK